MVFDPVHFAIHAGVGSFGGMMGILIGAPLDTIKVLIQTRPKDYRGPLDCVRKTVQREGFFALFKGSLTNAVGQIPNNAIVFGFHGSSLAYLNRHFPHWSMEKGSGVARHTNVFTAGCWAGFLQCLVLSPFEHVKCQLQVQKWVPGTARLGMVDVARSLVHARGVTGGLYRGLLTVILRDSPNYGLYFVTYDVVKHTFAPGEVDAPVWVMLLAGGGAGVVSWAFATPIDVIKSVIQGSPIETDPRETTIRAVATRLYKEQGYRAFFRGLSTSLLRAFPVNAVTLLVYDSLCRMLDPKHHKGEEEPPLV